jgi:predicted ABC-type ATPase
MPIILVLAGTNGAGKSSVGGEKLRRHSGEADYFNPDEEAAALRKAHPSWTALQANIAAWETGVRLLDDAIRERRDHYFETTLGGRTITGRLESAIEAGFGVRIWYVGLETVELHLARVAARVAQGGHNIPEADVRRRFVESPRNLARLTPGLAELKLFDNSAEVESLSGPPPNPRLLLHLKNRQLIFLAASAILPGWAEPVVDAARRLQLE